MKTMSCKQLGGASDHNFHADTFDEMAEQSKKHAMEMFSAGDEAHLMAMNEMQKLIQSSEAMTQWMDNKIEEFDALPDNA